MASLSTPSIEARTKTDWSAIGVICSAGGNDPAYWASVSRTPPMMDSVEAAPVFRMVSSEARCPLTRTMLVWGGAPSRTCATSCRNTTAPPADRIGRLLSPSIVVGLLLVSMAYSKIPILEVPAGRMRFWALMALTTSVGARPLLWSAGRSMSTWICALFAAVGIRDRGSFDRRELSPDGGIAEVEELLLREALSGQRQLKDRHGRGAVGDDERRSRARRHRAQDRLRDRRDLGDRGIDAGLRLKENLDHGDAGKRLRLDVLDVVDGGRHGALVPGHDAVGHFRGGEAAVIPDRADDGDVDGRKDVGRRALDDDRRHEEDHDRQHDERVGAAQRESDDPHGASASGEWTARGDPRKRAESLAAKEGTEAHRGRAAGLRSHTVPKAPVTAEIPPGAGLAGRRADRNATRTRFRSDPSAREARLIRNATRRE